MSDVRFQRVRGASRRDLSVTPPRDNRFIERCMRMAPELGPGAIRLVYVCASLRLRVH